MCSANTLKDKQQDVIKIAAFNSFILLPHKKFLYKSHSTHINQL